MTRILTNPWTVQQVNISIMLHTTPVTRLLLIEDEQDMARYLSKGLEEAGYSVTHADQAEQAKSLALTQQWDIMIVDRMLPHEQDGLDIIKHTRQAGIQTPVLVLSALASLDDRVRGLRGGGDDYLTKPFALPELLARLEALIRRATPPPNATHDTRQLKLADLTLDLLSRKAERAGQPITLQPREFKLLEYLVRNQGQVVTRTMLLESVWDFHFDPGTNVIDVQISRLRNKIDKGHSAPLVHTVRGVGYRFGLDG
jgi:two-component system OmpR family response regulator